MCVCVLIMRAASSLVPSGRNSLYCERCWPAAGRERVRWECKHIHTHAHAHTHAHTHTASVNRCSTIIFFKSAHRRFSSSQIIVFVMAYETKHRCIKCTNTLPLNIPIRHASAHLPPTAFVEHVTWSSCSFTTSSMLFMTFGSLMCVFFHNARLKYPFFTESICRNGHRFLRSVRRVSIHIFARIFWDVALKNGRWRAKDMNKMSKMCIKTCMLAWGGFIYSYFESYIFFISSDLIWIIFYSI